MVSPYPLPTLCPYHRTKKGTNILFLRRCPQWLLFGYPCSHSGQVVQDWAGNSPWLSNLSLTGCLLDPDSDCEFNALWSKFGHTVPFTYRHPEFWTKHANVYPGLDTFTFIWVGVGKNPASSNLKLTFQPICFVRWQLVWSFKLQNNSEANYKVTPMRSCSCFA